MKIERKLYAERCSSIRV